MAEGIVLTNEERLRSLNTILSNVVAAQWLADKLNVQPWVIGAVSFCWITSFMLWGFTGELMCMVIGFLYPMYGSFKALENEQHEEVTQWLKYWTVYSALSLAENVFYWLLVWMPCYHLLRILVVLWLFLPSMRGAERVYSWLVGPFLRYYSPKIDAVLTRSAEEVRETLGSAAGYAVASDVRSVLRKAAVSGAGYVAQDLGMEDLMMRELTKVAHVRLDKATSQKTFACESPAVAGSRARVSSPVPRYSPGPVSSSTAGDNKENVGW